ncbi:hypothetical protein ROJ8625_03757 [Roseivivax jejudonensis]|uniref:TniQ domain-containing protein n=1 Tax=Roseivivax jejudonensis TaxID=1529041 RepID=A0A1X7A6P0_9RHOB|nr:TniQ family protein [Roseivivax jejudonensis]SLN71954.1 hypothetical protein ROJ8625_03757 [Roseivivax jejudonensis]
MRHSPFQAMEIPIFSLDSLGSVLDSGFCEKLSVSFFRKFLSPTFGFSDKIFPCFAEWLRGLWLLYGRNFTPNHLLSLFMAAKETLKRRPRPASRETFLSFLSRAASMNGVTPNEFAFDMGTSFKRIIDTNDAAIEHIGLICDLTGAELDELVSWTGRRLGDVRMLFRGETMVSRAIRHPTVRGCPCCLMEDAEASGEEPVRCMIMRGDWQVRHVAVCRFHGRPLVPIWSENLPSRRYDLASRLRDVSARLMSGELTPLSVPVTAYDTWLDKRLETGEDATWLAELPVHSAATFCRLLGGRIRDQHVDASSPIVSPKERESCALGFKVLDAGKYHATDVLRDLGRTGFKKGKGPRGAYGSLYTWLAQDLENKQGVAELQNLLRDVILGIWPFGPGECVLGKTLTGRRLHSLSSASAESGIHQGTLRKALIERGVLLKEVKQHSSHETFAASHLSEITSDIRTMVTTREFMAQINATKAQLRAMMSCGLIQPALEVGTAHRPWRPYDGARLLERLLSKAVSLNVDSKGWCHIHTAARLSGISPADIVQHVEAGTELIGKHPRYWGYAAVFVPEALVQKLRDKRPPTLAEFARSIGIRENGAFAKFVAEGHTPATKQKNPVSGRKQHYITGEDAEAFHKRFFTVTSLAKERGVNCRTIEAEIRRLGLTSFNSPSQPNGQIFSRDYADARAMRAD